MSQPSDTGLTPPAATDITAPQTLSLLLIEDDRGDAILVRELVSDALAGCRLHWVQTMAEAEARLGVERPDCVLLDMNLPDAPGVTQMTALDRLSALDKTIPIVVFTGMADEHFGVAAVASGAQDYLVKGRVEPDMLRRAVLYSIERKRSELAFVGLHASQRQAADNARLERALLPSPLLLDDPGVDIVARYHPSRENALLGGDFYDFIQTPDRTVHVMVGDVAGHGPDEAALAVALRIAWRTLTFAGLRGVDRMRELNRVLTVERPHPGIFATVLSLAIPPAGPEITAVRAGHPGMLLHHDGAVDWVVPPGAPALGVHDGDWLADHVELPRGAGLILLTDGLFEGHIGPGNERLGEEGLLELARSLADRPGVDFVDALIAGADARAQSRGGLSDDIVVVRVERTRT